MVRIRVEYQGALRCEATHGPSGRSFVTDAPLDNHGRGESFSPTDLVATALGTCMLTVMGITAEKRGWDLSGATLEVEKHMVADPARRVGKLEVVLRVPTELDEAARAELERAALGCPVARTLEGRVELPVRFEWGAAALS